MTDLLLWDSNKLLSHFLFSLVTVSLASDIIRAAGFDNQSRNDSKEGFRDFLLQRSSSHSRSLPAVLERSSRFDRSENLRSVQFHDSANSNGFESNVIAVEPNARSLASAVHIFCNAGFMLVALEKQRIISSYGLVHEAEISFRDENDSTCRPSAKASNLTHFALATMYEHCQTHSAISRANDISGTWLSADNQVILRLPRKNSSKENVTEFWRVIVNVSCSVKINDARQTDATRVNVQDSAANTGNSTFLFNVFNRQFFNGDMRVPPITYPYAVAVGSLLYYQIKMVSPTIDENLKAHVKECFLSPFEDFHLDTGQYIIKSGCPATGAVSIYHQKALPVGQYSRFNFAFDRDVEGGIYVHCKAVVCSMRATKGYDQCPGSTFCANRNIDDVAESQTLDHSQSFISAGPFTTFIETTVAACPPCPTVPDSLLTIAAEAQHFDSEANVPNGFSIAQVVAIALASFVIGLLFMAGIWFVHRQTDPRQYLNANATCDEDQRSNSYAHSSTLTAQLPDHDQ